MLIKKINEIYNIKSDLLPNGINAPNIRNVKKKNLNLIIYFLWINKIYAK